MDYIHAINQVIEKSAEYNIPLYLAFIDYGKAFESVEIAAVMKELRYKGVEEAYIRLLEDKYKDCTGIIIIHKQSEKFHIRKGVRQGYRFSPKLFTAYLESVLRMLDWDTLGVGVIGQCLGHLRFAGDIVLLCNSVEDLQRLIHDLHRESIVVGFKINIKKSTVLSNSLAVKQPFTIGNEILQEVYAYSYLGQLLSTD